MAIEDILIGGRRSPFSLLGSGNDPQKGMGERKRSRRSLSQGEKKAVEKKSPVESRSGR